MDRLFTTFVSSTFKDLKDERQRIVSVLLGHQCVPFGMEFFPSTGESQWPIITASIDAADFCVFIVAGRYGTISDDGETSWTQREFREAVRLKKPIVALLHGAPEDLPVRKSEDSERGRQRLQRFRQELEKQTVCRYYETEADLIEALGACIGALRQGNRISGWVPAKQSTPQDPGRFFDRTYQLMDVRWSFSRSAVRADTWDGRYRGRRKLVAHDPNGLEVCTLNFTRETDQQLPFDDTCRPTLRLVETTRERPGQISLDPPRKQSGSTFMQDVRFSPPLGPGEAADFTIEGSFPAYKFAAREDLAAATLNSKAGPRIHDWTSRHVTYPTEFLRISTFLPLDLEATPRGPMLGRDSSRHDPDLSNEVLEQGCYTCVVTDVDGIEGHEMTLETPNPRLRVRHRVGWHLPPRAMLVPLSQTSGEDPHPLSER